MNPSAPVRVALIGYGFAGRTFHAPLIGSVPGLSLDLVASSAPDRVRSDLPETAVEPDPLKAVASDAVDLVVIATPNATHAPLAHAALRAGKHVVVDKPMTPTLQEAHGLAALATARGLLLSVFHNRRWDSDFLSLSHAVRAGAIGELLHLESRIERFRPEVRDRWRERPGPATGLWWDLGPHLVDQALLLLGMPDTVHASFASQRPGAMTDDWAHVVLGFGRSRAVLQVGMVAAEPGPRFVAHGPGGSLTKARPDRQERQLLSGLHPGADDWGTDPDPLRWRRADQSVESIAAATGDQSTFYRALRDAIRGEGPNPVPPDDAIRVMQVLEAAARSAAEGRVVALPSRR